MLFNLSVKNIKKSIKDYSIYFFTLVVAVVIFYVFNSIEAQESMMSISDSKTQIIKALVVIINYLSVFVSFILGFLIIYSNNFLIKRRKKEFGLYLTLGMSKRKVSTILVVETLIVGLLSLAVGLVLGVFLSQFLSIFTANLFQVDMSNYKFIFSSYAMVKSITYFGLIFLFVMIFNVISLSRYKLIDLLNAKKKNEKVRFRNKYVIFISFILAFVLLAYAYHSLFNGVLFSFDNNAIYMLVAGALGTFLLFFSAAGFFLKIFQLVKKSYYKNLNMFVLKQINSKINTSVISTTIICLMLLLTIGILSGSLSLANVYNSSIADNNKTDFSMTLYDTSCTVGENGATECMPDPTSLEDISKEDYFKNKVDEYVYYTIYETDSITIESMVDSVSKKDLYKKYGKGIGLDMPLDIISVSDYNEILKLYGKNEVTLDSNEYILTSNSTSIIDYYKTLYEDNNSVKINNTKLYPATDKIVNIGLVNSAGAGNGGTVIVNDDLIKNLKTDRKVIIGNYIKTTDIEELDTAFYEHYNGNIWVATKITMEVASVGLKAIVIFIGLYLGIIFAISSATILAIGQLSESSDNKDRYKVLRQIGADEKMIKRALLTQIATAFMIPLVVALVHAYFGLRELNGTIELIGDIDLTSNIIWTTMFIVVVYGGYFLATYLCSKTIVKEN